MSDAPLPPERIPRASLAVIGGSGTFSSRFPEDLEDPAVRVLAKNLRFDTPYGPSPLFKLFSLSAAAGEEKLVLTVKMHGRRFGVTAADASRQVFWVFQQAGVKKILAEGGVGGANHLLELRDMVVPDDYIDLSLRRDVDLGGPYLGVMRRPVCSQLAQELIRAANAHARRHQDRRVFGRGVYAVTDGRHFESVAEVAMLRRLGADIVGMTMCPEVYLAREIGACYAGLYIVVNYGEGVIREWNHADLEQIFYEEARPVGRMLLEALRRTGEDQGCGCPDLRKPTLLVERPEE